MNKNKQIFELYIDYLVTSFSYTTATGLSAILDGDISSADLWINVKKDVREIESKQGVLIFDDTVQEKRYSSENTLINWHFDIPLVVQLKALICSTVFIIPMK
jgi:hypothetical protein